MATLTLSIKQAQAACLRAQGLTEIPAFGRGETGVRAVIQSLGYIQIDSISVIERAHHHVLWSRVPDYTPYLLESLVSEKKVIYEHWSHAAAYLPMQNFRFSLPLMRRIRSGDFAWFTPKIPARPIVMNRIRREGPLRARDFEAPSGFKAQPWFGAKPAKRALHQLFMEGKLMIAGRRGIEKIYDLRERVLPKWVDLKYPGRAEFAQFLVRQATSSHAIVQAQEISYLRKGMKSQIDQAIKSLLKAKEIIPIRIEGSMGEALYARADLETLTHQLGAEQLSILSPFDNLVIQRRRLQWLFNWDYQIECYVPEPKRKFGYFCLPIILGDKFVGMLDAKAFREEKVLRVRRLHLHRAYFSSPTVKKLLEQKLLEFARFNGCSSFELESKSVLNTGSYSEDRAAKKF